MPALAVRPHRCPDFLQLHVLSKARILCACAMSHRQSWCFSSLRCNGIVLYEMRCRYLMQVTPCPNQSPRRMSLRKKTGWRLVLVVQLASRYCCVADRLPVLVRFPVARYHTCFNYVHSGMMELTAPSLPVVAIFMLVVFGLRPRFLLSCGFFCCFFVFCVNTYLARGCAFLSDT